MTTGSGGLPRPYESPGAPTGGGGGGWGTGQVPDSPSVAALTLHNGYSIWHVSWTAERINGVPQVPNPVSSLPDIILMSYVIDAVNVGVLPDGDVIVTMSGEYEYIMLYTLDLYQGINIPMAQWVDGQYGDVGFVFQDSFVNGLCDPGGGAYN
jgi:hypothetical protein